MKYTIKNLRNDFPTDEACLDFIFKNRWPKGLTCQNCESKDFYHVKGRKSYACKCGYQASPTEGTIFHKSSTPLTLWFHAIFLMSQSKNGVAAKELERQLGVTYKCAWRMARQIRLLMTDDDGPLGGNEIVELDETYVDGKKMSASSIKKAYWHEKVHCVLDIMSEPASDNERFVDLMGHLLQQIEATEKW